MKCVSTLNDTGYPAFDPIPFSGSAEDTLRAIESVVAAQPRTKVKEKDATYLCSIFTTKILRFKDTVEFELDTEAGLIHFRSESVPYAGSDLGANRKRMELVRAELVSALS